MFKPKRNPAMTLEQAQTRINELNALEGFERWRLQVWPEGQYQVLDLERSGKVRWKSFRRDSLRAVVGWAAQQTSNRQRTQVKTIPEG